MNRALAYLTSFTFLLIFIVSVGILCADNKVASSQKPKTPSQDDFKKIFLSLPDSEFHKFISNREQNWREAVFLNQSKRYYHQLDSTNLDLYFLQINSLTDGAGHSYAIQWMPQNNYLIFIDTEWGGMCCSTSKIKILKNENSKWQDVTDTHFPKLSLKDFYSGPIDAVLKNRENEVDVIMFWNPDNKILEIDLAKENYAYYYEDFSQSENSENQYKNFEKHLKKKSFIYKWQNNRFEISK